MIGSAPRLSGNRFTIEYLLHGPEAQARRMADCLCLDQTIEAPEELLSIRQLNTDILGRVESFTTLHATQHCATVSFPLELFGSSCAQLLHTLYGTASLKPGIRVARFNLSSTMPNGWPGARLGRTGLRVLVDVLHRPLVCGVLKPLGLPPSALADLASDFALAGVDVVKDDQGLADHSFCPFAERVQRCAEAVDRANRDTGKRCLYAPHVSGSWETVYDQCLLAKKAGAGGVLIAPGLTGYDTLRELIRDDGLALPIFSHPALMGSYYTHPEHGMAPELLFGQLPRVIGADVTIFPTYGVGFPISQQDCRAIATACSGAWGSLKPIFPTAAGRMGEERIREMVDLFGPDVMFILGSQVQLHPDGLRTTCQRFLKTIELSTG